MDVAEQPDFWPSLGTEERTCMRSGCGATFQAERDPGTRPFALKVFCDPCNGSVPFFGEILNRAKGRRRATPKVKTPPKPARKPRVRPATSPEVATPREQPHSEPDAAMTAAADSLLRGENLA